MKKQILDLAEKFFDIPGITKVSRAKFENSVFVSDGKVTYWFSIDFDELVFEMPDSAFPCCFKEKYTDLESVEKFLKNCRTIMNFVFLGR